MTHEKYIDKKHLRFALVILVVVLCTACGAKIIRGASPLMRLNELSHQNNSITLKLSMRNLNGLALDVQNIDLSLTMNSDHSLTYKGSVDTNIAANGTETWSVDIVESKSNRELLNTLQNGDIKSLPYTLKGSITTLGDGTMRFEHEGHLYPLPGRPGHFR